MIAQIAQEPETYTGEYLDTEDRRGSGLVGMLLSSNYNHYGSLADKAYMAAPYPPGLRPAQLASIDSFLQGTAGSQERLEEKRRNAGD